MIKIRNKMIFLFVLCLFVAGFANNIPVAAINANKENIEQQSEGISKSTILVNDEVSLRNAISSVPTDGTEVTIKIDNVLIDITEKIVIKAGQKIFLTSQDATKGMIRASSFDNDSMIYIEENAYLTIENMQIRGRDLLINTISNKGVAIQCEGGLTLLKTNNNPFVRNHQSTVPSNSTIQVSGEKSEFNMIGGFVSYNDTAKATIHLTNGATMTMENNGVVGGQWGNSSENETKGVFAENATLNIKNGKIGYCNMSDENTRNDNIKGYGGGVYLTDNSILNLEKDGEITGNYAFKGSGVYATGGSKVNIEGSINSNRISEANVATAGYGAGVYAEDAEIILDGGEISSNRAQHYNLGVSGAGIYIKGQKTSFLMKGGKISSNSSSAGNGSGGGVYVNDAKFTMQKGTINNNSVKQSGGGIYITGDSAEVNIYSGQIIDNKGGTYGGGIYTNNGSHLVLHNTVIHGNSVSKYGEINSQFGDTGSGGGLWVCPAGDVNIYDFRSVGIFDNNAETTGDDVFSVSKSGTSQISLTHSTLGGGTTKWFVDEKDGKRYTTDNYRDEFVNLQGNTHSFGLKSIMSSTDKTAAKNDAQLVISGNSATVGGGIAANGTLEFGTEVGFSVRKVDFEDDNKVLENAQFHLSYKDNDTVYYYKTVLDGVIEWTVNEEDAYLFETSDEGVFDVAHLELGQKYSLKEIKAPNGYEEEKINIEIEFTLNGDILVDAGKYNDYISLEDDGREITIVVKNKEEVLKENTNIQLKKIDKENSEELEGAEFILSYVEQGITYYYCENNNVVNWTTNKNEATKLISRKDGIDIKELEYNQTYILKETKAPEGYELIEDFLITINVDTEGKITVDAGKYQDYIELKDKTLLIKNKKEVPEEPEKPEEPKNPEEPGKPEEPKGPKEPEKMEEPKKPGEVLGETVYEQTQKVQTSDNSQILMYLIILGISVILVSKSCRYKKQ